MLADITGPHLDFLGGLNSLSHGSANTYIEYAYKHYTICDMKVTERLIARHALTNTVGDRLFLFIPKTTRRKEAQAVAASLRDIRLKKKYASSDELTVKMIRIRVIAPFHDEKTNVFSICYFGSLIFFKHFKFMIGEALPPFPHLTARHCFKQNFL